MGATSKLRISLFARFIGGGARKLAFGLVVAVAFLLMPVMAWGAGLDGVTASALPGEDYEPGTALVDGIELSGGEGGAIAVDSNGSVGINATVTIQNIDEAQASSVWLAFEFSIPKVGTDYGDGFYSSWSFAEGSYSWLMDLDDPTKVATPVEEDGSIVLRGMVLTENSGGNVLNSRYTRTVQVENSGSKDGEQVEVDARAWIASDGEDGAESASPVTVRVSANAEYSARNSLDGPQISGYYNATTGQFSTVKPSSDEGYVYGRVYTSRVSISRKNTATEWIDPAATVETTVSFELEATDETGDTVVVPDDMQPIVIGAKRCDKRLSARENQLEDAPLQDLSFGGLIGNPYDAWNMGEYTFRVDEDDPTAVTASSVDRGQVPTLGDDSLPHFVAFVFVPLDRSGDSTIAKLTLTSTVADTKVQTVGGTSTIVTCPESTKAVPLAPKEDDDVVAMFSRWTNAYELPNTAEAGGTKTITNAVTGGGNVVDYQVRAVNQLIKFSSGLEPTKVYEHGKLWLNYRDIPGSGEKATQTFLWAVKPDGKEWKDAQEMSETRADELLYYDYDRLGAAKRAGTVVGVLVEYRGGMWQSGGMLAGVAIDFQVTGEPGTVGSCVQDVYMWMSGEDTGASYAGLNGAAPTQEAKDWNGQMFPTEAKEGYYRPGTWLEGSREPQELDSNTYGDTIYIMAGTVGIDKAESLVLNGTGIDQDGKHGAGNAYWPISAFDFGQDQRIVDRVLAIEVTGAEDMPVHISVDLDVTSNSVFSLYGGVHLSTEENQVTYIPGENAASPGTFTGGQALTEGDLQDLTLPGPGTYKLYYSSLIGNPTDLSEDITEAADYESRVQIKLLDTSVRDFMLGRSDQCYYSTVSLMSASGLDKRADSPVAGDTFTWTLSYTAATQDARDVFVLDVLPFAQDGRGTTFTGSYCIVDGEVPISYTAAPGSEAAGSLLRLFYTTDPKIRKGELPTADIFKGMGEDELAGGTITVKDMIWTKAKLNETGDAYLVPTDEKLTAVMLCGDVMEGERATATLSFDASSLEGGAVLVNSATYRNATSRQASETGDVKITKGQRSVEGLAFLDTDGDDIYEQGTDTPLPGLAVELFKALEGGGTGGRIEFDTSGRAYAVSTEADGSYRFEDVPESEHGYVVKFSSSDGDFADRLSCLRWATGAKVPGGADGSAVDSDIGGLSDEGGAFVATTDAFTLPNDAGLVELGVASFVYGGVNAGFEEGVHLSYDDNVQDEVIEVPSDATLYRSGSTATVSSQVPVRAGWTFAGWDTEPDGTGEACAPGGTITLVADTVLYAQWSKVPVGSLTVRKVLAGTGAESDRRFTMTVTLEDATVTGRYGDMEFTDGVATVELAGGESSTATGLPAGTEYRVSEQDYSADGYTSAIEQAEGTVRDGGSAEVTVTNRRDATGPVNPGGPGDPTEPAAPEEPGAEDVPTDRTDAPHTEVLPRTGDNSLAPIIGVALVAICLLAAGIGLLVRSRRRLTA